MVEHFTLQFIFEDKDHMKALKLHKVLKKYGVLGAITYPNDNGISRKKDRLEHILDSMDVGVTYTTGQLRRVCKIGGSVKTFQRDLNTLLVLGKVTGIPGIHPTKQGRTFFWTRGDIIGRYPK